VKDRIEEQQSIGPAGNREVVGGVVESWNEGREGSEVTACRTAGGGDAVGIDAEFGGPRAHEAQG
jgi:hypothetical protein